MDQTLAAMAAINAQVAQLQEAVLDVQRQNSDLTQ
jgi:hypothetical protein